MNTKLFIISIALILMFPQKTSIGAATQKEGFQAPAQQHISAPQNNKQNHTKSIDFTFDGSYSDSIHNSHNNDDDNKTYHFHYNRFQKHRNRILLSILLKMLLTITHLSSLIFATMHLLH
jgi:hypothetical protein